MNTPIGTRTFGDLAARTREWLRARTTSRERTRPRVGTAGRLLIVMIGLAVLLVIADRVAERIAADATAGQLRTSLHLARDPGVHFTSFPFLTQALVGRFSEIDIEATDVPTPGVALALLNTRLYGVRAGLSQVLTGRLDAVPVGRADATATLRYSDLDPLLAGRLGADGGAGVLRSLKRPVLAERDGGLAVTAEADLLGRPVPVEVDCALTVDSDTVGVVPQRVRLPLLGEQRLTAAVGERLAVRIPTQALPFGLRVRAVTAQPDTLAITAESAGFVLSAASN